jgi:hypothetical protein
VSGEECKFGLAILDAYTARQKDIMAPSRSPPVFAPPELFIQSRTLGRRDTSMVEPHYKHLTKW